MPVTPIDSKMFTITPEQLADKKRLHAASDEAIKYSSFVNSQPKSDNLEKIVGRVTALENKPAGVDAQTASDIANLKSSVAGHGSRLDTVEGVVGKDATSGLQGSVAGHETRVSNLENTVGKDATSGLQATVAAHEADLANIKIVVGADATSGLQKQVADNAGKITVVEGIVGADANSGLQGSVAGHETRVGNLENTVGKDATSGLQKQVADNAGEIAVVKGVVGADATSGLQKTVADNGQKLNNVEVDVNTLSGNAEIVSNNLKANFDADATLKTRVDHLYSVSTTGNSAQASAQDTGAPSQLPSQSPTAIPTGKAVCKAFGDGVGQSKVGTEYNPLLKQCSVPQGQFALVNKGDYDLGKIEASFQGIVSSCVINAQGEFQNGNSYIITSQQMVGTDSYCFVTEE